jgi:hypothetical protein
MTRLSEARRVPFSNGEEGRAWMSVWCEYCAHDHDMSHADATYERGCEIIALSMMLNYDEWPENWPEAWIPEPDNAFHLPSLLVCTKFKPCQQGECDGDPQAQTRANVIEHTTTYWREHGNEEVPA